jgi:hypothetical protein
MILEATKIIIVVSGAREEKYEKAIRIKAEIASRVSVVIHDWINFLSFPSINGKSFFALRFHNISRIENRA